jgi:hypothetical protein
MSDISGTLPAIPEPTTTGPVNYAHGVSFEWVEDGRIAVFTITDSSRPSVDTFINIHLAFAQQNRGKTIYTLSNASSPDVTLTPYLRQKSTKLAEAYEQLDITLYRATVVQAGFFTTIVKLFINMLANPSSRANQKLFNDYGEALDWLKAQLPD